ncbi:MAG: YfhO family protein [Candidatus Hydrogenedentes bacterium]|nr:YfhO family protein [Candidatus Hydrogenedentota bacterium]
MTGFKNEMETFLKCLGALLAGLIALLAYYWLNPDWRLLIGTVDSWRYFGPLCYFIDYWLHQGELPTWNPLILCGTPVTGNPQATLFYPLNLLRSLLTLTVTPMNTFIGLFVLNIVHILIAGLGAFYLARVHKLSLAACYVAAFAFAFSPAVLSRLPAHYHIIAHAAWLPWLLFFLRHACASEALRQRFAHAALAGLMLGLMLLAGFTDLSIYAAVAAATYLILYLLLHDWPVTRKTWPAVKHVLGYAAVFGILLMVAAGIAMPLLLPGLQLSRLSERLTQSDQAVYTEWTQRLPGMPEDVSPGYLLESYVLFYGPFQTEREMTGAGIVALLLAVLALTHRRRRDVLLVLGVFLVLLDCSLGPPFPVSTLARWLAPYQMGWPFRAHMVVNIAYALLAAYGLDALLQAKPALKTRIIRTGLVAGIGLLVFLMLGYWIEIEQTALNPSAWMMAPPAIALALLVTGIWIRWRVVAGLVAVALLSEAILWNYSFFAYAFEREKPNVYYERPPETLMGGRTHDIANHRGMGGVVNLSLFNLDRVMNGYEPLHIAESFAVLDAPGEEQLFERAINGYEPTALSQWGNLFLKRPFWLTRQYVRGVLPQKDVPFPAATTCFINDDLHLRLVPEVPRESLPISGISDDALRTPIVLEGAMDEPVIASSNGKGPVVLTLAPLPLPKLHSVLEIRYRARAQGWVQPDFIDADTGERTLGTAFSLTGTEDDSTFELAMPDFDSLTIRLEVNLTSEAGYFKVEELTAIADGADEQARIQIIRYTATTAEVELVDLPGPRILLFTDAAFPGWRATVDGHDAEILVANNAFKAIEVPAGTHRVRFQFTSARTRAGLLVALAVLAIVTGYWLWLCRVNFRRRPAGQNNEPGFEPPMA